MTTITDEQVEAALFKFYAGLPLDSFPASAWDDMRAALTSAAQAGKPLPTPKSFHWLGDREAAEITLHAPDVRGCVAYFDRQSDCLEFMRQVTNSATAYEGERVDPPLPGGEGGRWFKRSFSCEEFVIDNVVHGEVTRGIEETWCATFHSRNVGRGFEDIGDARAAVMKALAEYSPAPATPGRADDWQLVQALQEMIRRTRTRLEFYCNEANAGRMPSDAREFMRRVQCGFDSLQEEAHQMLAASPSPPAQSLANEPYLEVVTPFNMLCPDCGDVGLNYKNGQMVKKVDCPKCGLRLFSMTPPAQSCETPINAQDPMLWDLYA